MCASAYKVIYRLTFFRASRRTVSDPLVSLLWISSWMSCSNNVIYTVYLGSHYCSSVFHGMTVASTCLPMSREAQSLSCCLPHFRAPVLPCEHHQLGAEVLWMCVHMYVHTSEVRIWSQQLTIITQPCAVCCYNSGEHNLTPPQLKMSGGLGIYSSMPW